MGTQDNIGMVRSVFEGFNRDDLDGAVANVARDFEGIDIPSGQSFHGPEGLRGWLEVWKRAVPDGRAELTNVFATDDWVFTEHTGRGTHTGPLVGPAGEIPPTGRQIEVQMAEVYQLRDGKIVLMRAYYDTSTLLQQLGLIPTPERARR